MEDQEGYIKDKVTINMLWANVLSVLVLISSAVVFGSLYYLVWRAKVDFSATFEVLSNNPLLVFLVMCLCLIIGMVAHELIHGIVWAMFAKNGFKSIRFGVVWKMLTPYCHCSEPLAVKQYALGGIMPTILLGIIPALLAIAIGSVGLLAFGVFFITAGSGDLLVIYALRHERGDALVEDHPSEVGYFVYRPVESPH
ncbi:MAG: DUF3267 domain-containing protein [Coriobacteriales bacterium]|nr:DUF3267 domain-containing protein [Coriobacteriales bacterium]